MRCHTPRRRRRCIGIGDEKGFAGLLSSPLMASLLFFCLAEIFGDKREKEWFSRRVSNNF
jgi:hypothetical protein